MSDDYTAHLVDIAKRVLRSPTYQPVVCGLIRSDYMIDGATNQMLQIELNTISCSFPGVEEKLTAMHRFLLASHPESLPSIAEFLQIPLSDIHSYITSPSFNQTLHRTAASFAAAVDVYRSL